MSGEIAMPQCETTVDPHEPPVLRGLAAERNRAERVLSDGSMTDADRKLWMWIVKNRVIMDAHIERFAASHTLKDSVIVWNGEKIWPPI